MQFRDITIKNFRGIDYLEIKDFASINIFVGKNNVGKTSILEAIFLLSGMSNLPLALQINGRRGVQTHQQEDGLRYLFHNMSLDKQVSIKGHLERDGVRQLTISPKFKSIDTGIQGSSSSLTTKTEQAKTLLGLIAEYGIGDELKYHDELLTDKDPFEFKSGEEYEESILCTFLSPVQRSNKSTQEEIDSLIKAKKKRDIVECLQLFDLRVRNLESSSLGIFVEVDDVGELLPLGMLGDGMSKYLNIIASALVTKIGGSNVILLDEFENGLHYTAQRKLWSILCKIVEETGLQLFITTHSVEALRSLADEMKDADINDDFMSLYTIDSTEEAGLQAYRYNAGGIRIAIENEIELRS
jgi:hypothetical protein BACCOPRO_00931